MATSRDRSRKPDLDGGRLRIGQCSPDAPNRIDNRGNDHQHECGCQYWLGLVIIILLILVLLGKL